MNLTDNVEQIKGIGEERAKKLKKLGIYTVYDLITHYPRDYMDRSIITAVALISQNIVTGEGGNAEYTVRGYLTKNAEVLNAGGKIIVKATISDGTGVIEAVWFNQLYLRNIFKKGKEFMLTGAVQARYGILQMESPDYEAVGGDKELLKSGRITPVYPSTDKLSQNLLRTLIKTMLDNIGSQIQEVIPASLMEKYGLCGRLYAMKNIHFPESDEAFFKARERLVFEELLLMQLTLFHIKGVISRGKGYVFDDIETGEIEGLFPYTLTNGQREVINDLKSDFKGGAAMNRLIQGDVGSGKTAVALIGCYVAVRNGYQAAIMAPTEVLAAQHYVGVSGYFEKLGIRTELLVGSVTPKKKKDIKERLSLGEIDVLIGTHALIQDNVVFKKLGFVVTDEQHRFGVRQRAKLSEKGSEFMPHTLVMTATPIPRTLALILYGDLDISSITELPPGRQKIETSAVGSSYRRRIYTFIQKQVEEGRQIYIICPAIEANEVIKVKSVLEYTESLKSGAFSDLRVTCLHGKMPPKDKQYIMDSFTNGEIDVLISTTVIEVGINVPNATVILIENSERFGLSQLHQLRGRVGRGKHKSYCILISDSKSETSKSRMKAMVSTGDGFALSEMDLTLRGPGEFFGTRQHGILEMKIANLYKDTDILRTTQEAAMGLYECGRYMKYEGLYAEINRIAGLTGTIFL